MSRARSERGFSMFFVVVALLLTSMFAAAAFAATNGDLPISGMSKDRKTAYAAAEAGLNYYQTHLNQDPDYWTHCDTVPAPGPGQPNPVNPVWDGTTTRRWRNVTDSPARYTIEVLPANGAAKCVVGDQTSVIDKKTGTFRIRVTGQPRSGSSLHRSIIATFRRKSFLDYLWFTDYEDKDPQAFATQTERTNADTNCKGKYRPQRPSSCTEIEWITNDGVAGPVHSNDSLLICGTPTFGRDLNDPVESMQTVGRVSDSSPCTDSTNMKGKWKTGAGKLTPPTDDQPLKAIAQPPDGLYYQGRTIIRLHGTLMDVRRPDGTLDLNKALPTNGVIFVDNSPTSTCNLVYPSSVTYAEDDSGCGNVYVSGYYSTQSLTIAAANDVIIAPTAGASLDWSSADESLTLQNGGDGVLGLIANRFVRVGHKVNRGSPCTNYASSFNNADLEVDAAILALQHSWIVDNYDCGRTGSLVVKGAIAQEYRGPVGTSGHTTGFLKAYQYDDRLRYRSPPYFLSPIAAQWTAIRVNEQLPASGGIN